MRFGRRDAGADPVVVEAVRRRVRDADEALVGIDTTLRGIQLDPGALWRELSTTQVVAHAAWLTKIFTRAASAFHHTVENPTPEALARLTELVEAAERWARVTGEREEALAAGRRTGAAVDVEPLPAWPVTPETQAGLWAALAAIVAEIRVDAERFLGFGFPRRFAADVAKLEAVTAREVAVFVERFEGRWATRPAEREAITADALRHVQESGLFAAGQSWWAPRLLGRDYERARRRPAGIDDLDVPDPWVLTDPRERPARQRDPASVEALVGVWEGLRRPGVALELQRGLDEALRQGLIRRREGRAVPTAPWPSRYLVRYPVTIGDRRFVGGDVVVLFVDLDGDPQVRISKSGRVVRPVDLLGQRDEPPG